MAHSTNKVSRLFDWINRDGYEWLLGYFRYPRGTGKYYQEKYKGSRINYRVAYFWGFFWRAALCVVPVLPALYCATRLLALANVPRWFSNPLKTVWMAVAVAPFVAAGTLVPASTLVNVATQWLPNALLTLAPAPVLAIGLATMAGALCLYCAKRLAQICNASLYNGQSSPKHTLEQCDSSDQAHFLHGLHAHELAEYTKLKTWAKEEFNEFTPKSDITAGKVPYFDGKPVASRVEYVEKTLEKGKSYLATLEKVIHDHHTHSLRQNDFDALLDSRKGMHYAWKAHSKQIDPNRSDIANEADIGLYRCDSENQRLYKAVL